MSVDEIVKQAEKNWYLDKLNEDLSSAKQKCRPTSGRKQKLSQIEYYCLCGLLCELSPKMIAEILNRMDKIGVRKEASQVYEYTEVLVESKTRNTVDIRMENFTIWMDKLGYNKINSPRSPLKTVKGRVIINLNNMSVEEFQNIVAKFDKLPGNAGIKIEMETGSIILKIETSEAGFDYIQELFQTGELQELLGVPIRDVKLEPVNLSQWLQNNFAEAIQAGWQTIEEIFTTATASQTFRFLGNEISENSADNLIEILRTSTDDRSLWKAADSLFQMDSSNSTAGRRRAKFIELDNQTFILSIGILQKANERIAIRAQVYSQNDLTHLPLNLKMIVLDEQGAIIKEIQPQSGAISIQWRFSGQIGDTFSVKIALNEVSITEDFVI